jgi:hypothetical protein
MSETRQLLEFVQNTNTLRVDLEACSIDNVRILGLESANGRSYAREGVGKAIGLYEGRQVNTDHPAKHGDPVPLARRLGWLEGVRQEEDGGLRGKLQLLKAHPLTPLILEAAQRRPQLMGLSHNALGKTRREGAKEIVESIDAVHSVDLVADPATVSGLHEGKITPMKVTVKQLMESLKSKRPGYVRALKEMAEAGLMSPDATMDAPSDDSAGSDSSDHEEALKSGFKAAIHAIIDDDSLDMAEQMKKIKEILKARDKLLNSAAATDDAPAEPMPATESLRFENKALKLCGQHGVKFTPLLEKAVRSCRSEQEVVELVESVREEQRVASAHNGARSAAPSRQGDTKQTSLQESEKVPEDPKARSRWLTQQR